VAALQVRAALTRPRARAQEDAWTVITAFFEEKGLVRQQLDSFNEFVNSQMQEIVDESGQLVIKPESQHLPGAAPPRPARPLLLQRCPARFAQRRR